MANSSCHQRFSHTDFDHTRLAKGYPQGCPVIGCDATLIALPYGKQKPQAVARTMPWCPEHGIRLHTGTFVYWNGQGQEDLSRLRNFVVEPALVRAIALRNGMKVESHRLGYEMSEDALSWNVFVSLAAAGRLSNAARFLTGREIHGEPDLYLWGWRISTDGSEPFAYAPLKRVRATLESDIRPFVTEPDIILVIEGEMVICIEAKFTSGNPLAHNSKPKPGEKPTTRDGLMTRYLGAQTSGPTKHAVAAVPVGARLHSQLFRNVVFASEMAGEVPWHVVNLVSETQRSVAGDSRYSFDDPTGDVREYLHKDWQHSFTYRTWEALHDALIKEDPELARLDSYLRGKSAHFLPAFKLN